MFELLGIALLLAALLTFNSIASFIMAGLWRIAGKATDGWTAAARARLLFSLRTIPALVAFAVAAMNPFLLSRIHSLIEHAVQALK